jgi:hypothetical protein
VSDGTCELHGCQLERLRALNAELLAALKKVVQYIGDAQNHDEMTGGMMVGSAWEVARGAIARAEGKQ